jgi:hypothetical protein
VQVPSRVLVGAATEVVPDGVHRGAAAQVQVGVEERGQQADDGSEDHDQDGDADGQPEQRVVEQAAVPLVLGDVLGVAGDRDLVLRLFAVHRHVHDLHADPPDELGRVRVALLAREGVVLAVHRHPLAGLEARRDPKQEPEDPLDGRRQRQGSVGERPVEVDGRAHVGHQRHGEPDQQGDQEGAQNRHHWTPPYRLYLPVGRASGERPYTPFRDAGVRSR